MAFIGQLLELLNHGKTSNNTTNNIKIAVVDIRPPPSLDSCLSKLVPDYRVYALSPNSINLLERIGAWKYIKNRSQSYNTMQIWEEVTCLRDLYH